MLLAYNKELRWLIHGLGVDYAKRNDLPRRGDYCPNPSKTFKITLSVSSEPESSAFPASLEVV
jgi:hypothetical protein